MFSLIKYELKKLCAHRLLPILLLLLTVINVYLISREAGDAHIQNEDILDRIVSDYTADSEGMEAYIDSCMRDYEAAWALGDKTLIPENRYTEEADVLFYERYFFPLRDYTANYQKTVQTALRIARGHIAEYEYLGYAENSFEISYQRGVIASYEKLAFTFPFVNIRGYDILLDYEGLGVLVMIAVLMGGMFLFIPEKNEKSIELIRSAKYGRGATFGAKMITAFLYTLVVSLLLTASAVLAVWLRCGLYGLFAPLQMVESYRLSPLMTNVLGGLVTAFSLRVFASFVFMVLVIAFASLVSGYIPAFFSGSLVIAANYVIATQEYFNAYDPLKNLNFFWTIGGKEPLAVWRGIRLFDRCIGAMGAIFLVYSILLFLGVLIAWYFYVGKRGIVCVGLSPCFAKFCGIVQIRFPERKKRDRATLFSLELKKWITPFSVLVFGSVLAVTILMCSKAHHKRTTFDEMVYDEYMQTYAGKWTPEKDARLQGEYAEMLALIGQKERMLDAYTKGAITFSAYQSHRLAAAKAESRIDVLEALCRTSAHLRELSEEGGEVYFVNERGWRRLYDTNLSMLYLFAVILLFSGMFVSDYKENFVPIRRATPRGRRRVVFCRVVIACVGVMLLITLCEWMQYADISNTIGLSLPEASVESLSFLGVKGITVGGYFILIFVKHLAIGIVFTLLTLFVSEKTKAYLSTLLIMSLIASAPLWLGISKIIY